MLPIRSVGPASVPPTVQTNANRGAGTSGSGIRSDILTVAPGHSVRPMQSGTAAPAVSSEAVCPQPKAGRDPDEYGKLMNLFVNTGRMIPASWSRKRTEEVTGTTLQPKPDGYETWSADAQRYWCLVNCNQLTALPPFPPPRTPPRLAGTLEGVKSAPGGRTSGVTVSQPSHLQLGGASQRIQLPVAAPRTSVPAPTPTPGPKQ
jgi:hypothetical protein